MATAAIYIGTEIHAALNLETYFIYIVQNFGWMKTFSELLVIRIWQGNISKS